MDGKHWDVLYFDLNYPGNSDKIPAGYRFKDKKEPSDYIRATNGKINDFPFGMKDRLKQLPVELMHDFENTQFVRLTEHISRLASLWVDIKPKQTNWNAWSIETEIHAGISGSRIQKISQELNFEVVEVKSTQVPGLVAFIPFPNAGVVTAIMYHREGPFGHFEEFRLTWSLPITLSTANMDAFKRAFEVNNRYVKLIAMPDSNIMMVLENMLPTPINDDIIKLHMTLFREKIANFILGLQNAVKTSN